MQCTCTHTQEFLAKVTAAVAGLKERGVASKDDIIARPPLSYVNSKADLADCHYSKVPKRMDAAC